MDVALSDSCLKIDPWNTTVLNYLASKVASSEPLLIFRGLAAYVSPGVEFERLICRLPRYSSLALRRIFSVVKGRK